MAQPLAVGDRLRSFIGLTDLFGAIDFGMLDDIFAAYKAAVAAVGSAAKLAGWVQFLKVVALATKTTQVDDQLAAALETIANGPLRDILLAIIERVAAQRASGVVHAASVDFLLDEERAAFQAAGIDPALVLTIVQMLLKWWFSK